MREKRVRKVKYHKNNPWAKHLDYARNRCNNKNAGAYARYGGRGIKCFITMPEIEKIWHRDSVHLLKHPSIDRIDYDGNYEFGNIRFIEKSKNIKKPANLSNCKRGHFEWAKSSRGQFFCVVCQRMFVRESKKKKKESITFPKKLRRAKR